MPPYVLGIDTGGTYTDAALLDAASGTLISRAKVPTCHHRLADGIAGALHRLLAEAPESRGRITSLAISSTLATNAVVEGKGARVAVMVIGYVKHFRLPVKAVLFLKGGHTITGEEEEPLDLDYLVSLLPNLRDEVDAYGVCAAMSMKNPSHELVVEKAIAMIDPKPVFCSHRVSDIAGMEERAATAGLHAKLMPLMEEFIGGVKAALEDERLPVPVHIVGGNGTLLAPAEAVAQAAMTVASGPACTALFGLRHGPDDCLVVDVGGTTTDITMIRDGRPLLNSEGCRVGNWRTRVQAIDMFTSGIGGDSLVRLGRDSSLTIGPRRITPIAVAAETGDPAAWLGLEELATCFALRERPEPFPDDVVAQVLARRGPSTLQTLKEQTGLGTIQLGKRLEELARRQLISEIGFTPTDALHVLGRLDLGDQARARQAAETLGGLLGLTGERFAHRVHERTCELIEAGILEYLLAQRGKSRPPLLPGSPGSDVLAVTYALKIPIIGIGAAASFFLPRVAERLQTSVQFPENYQVGNAIGAALLAVEQQRPA